MIGHVSNGLKPMLKNIKDMEMALSNFETFQANRLKLRFKNKDGKSQLAHTLNGSSLALPRVLAGLLENCQTENGILIPEVLRKYTRFDVID